MRNVVWEQIVPVESRQVGWGIAPSVECSGRNEAVAWEWAIYNQTQPIARYNYTSVTHYYLTHLFCSSLEKVLTRVCHFATFG